MQHDPREHHTIWEPPPRPDWVSRVNAEGQCMDLRAVVPLDAESLLASAMRATGMSDFGADEWRESFHVFVRALDEEADLNLIGRLRTRSEIVQLLASRLQIEDTYRRHPEIESEKIRAPLFVVGQGRSGTSFLLNLLAADPDNGTMLQWEAMLPCPPPEAASYQTDPRIDIAHRRIDQWNRVTPSITTMHEFAGRMPEECCQLMAFSFMAPSWLDCFGQVPSWDAFMQTQDITPAIRYHERVLKLLQWRNPRLRWVLKDMLFIDFLPQVLQVYPDAQFVWTHRDPVRALASTISIIGTVQWGRSDHPFQGESFRYCLDPELSAQRFDRAIAQIQSGAVPARQLCNVQYRDLVRAPMAVVESVYAHFDLPLAAGNRAAMEEWLAANPRDARPPHRFGIGPETVVAQARRAYARYQAYFGVPEE